MSCLWPPQPHGLQRHGLQLHPRLAQPQAASCGAGDCVIGARPFEQREVLPKIHFPRIPNTTRERDGTLGAHWRTQGSATVARYSPVGSFIAPRRVNWAQKRGSETIHGTTV